MSYWNIHKAIRDAAKKNDSLTGWKSFSVLTIEPEQVFVKFTGIPVRGEVCVWVKVTTRLEEGKKVNIVGYEPGDQEEEEPRTVAFLRNEIDDLDYQLNQARTSLAAIDYAGGAASVPSYMLPFLKLTVVNAEDLRTRLVKELNDLWENTSEW